MPRSVKAPAVVSSIQERLTEAAQTFVQEILRALSVSTLAELSLLTGGRHDELVQVETPPPPAPKAAKAPREPKVPTPPVPTKVTKGAATAKQQKKKPNPRISAVRKEAGTKPVTCPVPGCTEPGIRSKMNFCRPHAESLPRTERVRLRQEQRVNKQSTAGASAPPPAEKLGKKAAKKKS